MQTKTFSGQNIEDCRRQLQDWVHSLDNFEVVIMNEDPDTCEITVSYRIIEG